MSRGYRYRGGFRLLFGSSLLIASWFALNPQPPSVLDGHSIDKLAHVATFLVLAWLIDQGWPKRGFDLSKWSFLMTYGLLIELLQSQIPNRLFSLADLLANGVGILMYVVLVLPLLLARGLR
jgi:VanZ family protein